MDYVKLLSRAWEVIWNNKFLIALGTIASLFSGSGTPGNFNNGGGTSWTEPAPNTGGFDPSTFTDSVGEFLPLILICICVVFVIGIALSYIGAVADGGMIYGTDQVSKDIPMDFGRGWSAGWNRGVTYFLVNIVPGLPGLLVALTAVIFMAFVFATNAETFTGDPEIFFREYRYLIFMLSAMFCMMGLLSLPLAILAPFARRACMLEETDVYGSYLRGWEVLRENISEALILFVIQIAVSVVIGMVMIVPSFVMTICFVLLPLLLVINGAIHSYLSAVWTLAWGEWTAGASDPASRDVAPAV